MVSPAARRGPRSDRGGRGPGRGGNRSGDGSGSSGGGERRGGRGGRGRDRERPPREDDSGGFSERVVHTRRIAKVVKGGRRLRFNALVVVGDGQGRVGAGMGKALAIPDAVRKGTAVARRGAITIPIKGSTIPHEISVRKGASIVIIKPAPLGTGIIAAGAMRAMLELGGVQDVVGKSLGSRNPINIVQATLAALEQLRDPETERAQRLGTVRPATNGAGAAATPSAATPSAATPAATPPPTATATPASPAAVTPPAAAPAAAPPPTAAPAATTPGSAGAPEPTPAAGAATVPVSANASADASADTAAPAVAPTAETAAPAPAGGADVPAGEPEATGGGSSGNDNATGATATAATATGVAPEPETVSNSSAAAAGAGDDSDNPASDAASGGNPGAAGPDGESGAAT